MRRRKLTIGLLSMMMAASVAFGIQGNDVSMQQVKNFLLIECTKTQHELMVKLERKIL